MAKLLKSTYFKIVEKLSRSLLINSTVFLKLSPKLSKFDATSSNIQGISLLIKGMYLVVEDINTLAKVVTVLPPIFSSSLFINLFIKSFDDKFKILDVVIL